MIIFKLNITMIELMQMLSSMFPLFDDAFTNTAYSSVLEDELLLRNMFEISCKPECNTYMYETVEEYPNHCFISDYVNSELFPEMEIFNYKLPGFYSIATCKTYRLYDSIVNRGDFWNERDINFTIMIASAHMRTNIYQLDEQRDILDIQEYQDLIQHNNYASIDLVNNIGINDVLNSKVDEIIEHVCDHRCMGYTVPSKVYKNEYIYETPDLCRIKDVELEEGRKYTFHYEYSNGMCKLFKLFQSNNDNNHVEPTNPPENNSGISDFELMIVIVGVVIILAIITAITICCVKNSMWYTRKQFEKEDVSP